MDENKLCHKLSGNNNIHHRERCNTVPSAHRGENNYLRISRDPVQPSCGKLSPPEKCYSSMKDIEEDDFLAPMPRERSYTCPEKRMHNRRIRKDDSRPPTPPPSRVPPVAYGSPVRCRTYSGSFTKGRTSPMLPELPEPAVPDNKEIS